MTSAACDVRGILPRVPVLPVLLATVVAIAPLTARAANASGDGCIDCHRDPNFLVTNKKLFDYFQEWRQSVHAQEGVTCVDCHGGDVKATSKRAAHKSMMAGRKNFEQVPRTCGRCHDEQYDAYVQSHHYRLMLEHGQAQKGPNCVTCHGSLNASALTVNSVGRVCSQCHNQKSGNHPEIADRAQALIDDLNAITGYYRYVRIRGDAEQTKSMLEVLDPLMDAMTNEWHTFDMDRIAAHTKRLLGLSQKYRDEVRERRRQSRENPPAKAEQQPPEKKR